MNIQGELIQAEAHGPMIRTRLQKETPSEAERDDRKARQLMFMSWCTCCVDGRVSGHFDRFCSSDRDVPQLHHFFTNCKNSTRMSSEGSAGLQRPVKRVTASSILDCVSGCTIKHASDKGTGRRPVSIVCKGVEFCCRKNRETLEKTGQVTEHRSHRKAGETKCTSEEGREKRRAGVKREEADHARQPLQKTTHRTARDPRNNQKNETMTERGRGGREKTERLPRQERREREKTESELDHDSRRGPQS